MAPNNLCGDRILRFLRNEYPVPQRAKVIALRTGMSYGYCRQVLSLMARLEPPLLLSTKDGYCLPGSSPPVPEDLCLENLCLTAKSNIVDPRVADGVPLLHGRNKAFPGHPIWFETFFERWRISIQRFKNGTVTLQLGANGGPGMGYMDFRGFVGWLKGGAEGAILPPIPTVSWLVKNIEFNKDHPGLRLEGANILTLQVFENVWAKLYNKPQGLRTEVRAAPVSVSLETAVQLFAKLQEEFSRYGVIVVQEVRG